MVAQLVRLSCIDEQCWTVNSHDNYVCMLSNIESGEDFSLEGTMVTFVAESRLSVSGSTQCVDIMVIGDSDYESDETAIFQLFITSFAQLGAVNSVTLTIRNDDNCKSST